MISEKFILLGAMLNLIGSTGYLRDTLRGKTRPNRISWFLWAVAPIIAFSAEITHGVGLPALMTFMVGFGPLLIFLGSFVNRKSVWKLTKLDIVCGILSVLAIVLWQLTGSGVLAIALSIAADALAGVPTLVKAYKDPDSESWNVFLFGGTSALITLLAINTWDFAHVAFPLYIFLICAALVVLIRFRVGVRGQLPLPQVDEISN